MILKEYLNWDVEAVCSFLMLDLDLVWLAIISLRSGSLFSLKFFIDAFIWSRSAESFRLIEEVCDLLIVGCFLGVGRFLDLSKLSRYVL